MFEEIERCRKWLWNVVLRLWILACSSTSCALGMAANVCVMILALPFVTTPAGTSIRPMSWAFLIGLIALGTLVFGSAAAALDALIGKVKSALIGFLLCCAPFPLAALLLNILALLKGFHLAD